MITEINISTEYLEDKSQDIFSPRKAEQYDKETSEPEPGFFQIVLDQFQHVRAPAPASDRLAFLTTVLGGSSAMYPRSTPPPVSHTPNLMKSSFFVSSWTCFLADLLRQ